MEKQALSAWLASAVAVLGLTLCAGAQEAGPRSTSSFDRDWKFQIDHSTAAAAPAAVPSWRWRKEPQGATAEQMAAADLPTDGADWHDAAPGDDTFHGRVGFSWYRAMLDAPKGAHRVLRFESVDDNATVFLNGKQLATHEGWSDAFDVPLGAAWNANGPNVLAIRVENTSGGGGIGATEWLEAAGAPPAAQPAAAVAFDDSAWRSLDLPHDFSIEGPAGKDPATMDGPFDEKSPAGVGGGALNAGIAWYRKTFHLPESDRGRHIVLQFDGVYMDSDVWINGEYLGNHPYGFTSFEYDLTPYLKFGEAANVVAVRVNVKQPCSRWYSGAGIYRNVWLTETEPVHVPQWGTYVTTPEVSDASARVRVRTHVVNDGTATINAILSTAIVAPDGKVVSTSEATQEIAAGKDVEFDQELKADQPRRWSLEDPALYHAVSEVRVGKTLVDRYVTPFGIRTIAFTADKGFFLNGKHVKIQGVCDHHDLGCLGAAVNRRAIQRQLEILKSFGVNAIRTSHNPPAPELLELCDEMGFVVMDEAFDEWKQNKTALGYGRFFDQWSERDIVSMLHRDRNHPCIVMWSIGNEIPEQGAKNGGAMAKRLSDFCHREDPTRFVTSACSNPGGAVQSGFANALDVFGINYNTAWYDREPQRARIGSETSSALSSRGEYNLVEGKDNKLEIKNTLNNQCTSYDLLGPGWGCTASRSLETLKDHPAFAGEFVWTGFDYIGEPTPFGWPSRSSYFGIVDLCGFPKDRYYLYQSQWTSKPMVHLLPHWNWAGFEGKEIPVWCFSNGDSVELFLNGTSLGEKTFKQSPTRLHLEWKVPYAPGVLKAVARKNGTVWATDEVRTAGPPAKLVLIPDRKEIAADGQDLSFITVKVVDKDGNICPNADNKATFNVTGPATIAGVDNGDATNHESFQGNSHKTFHGLALVVIKAGREAGDVSVTATADGLASDTATLDVRR
jgi:beta-galactosidase